MGKWREEANRQIAQFTTGERMNTENAMQLIAYWIQETGEKRTEGVWFPLVQKVIKQSPPYKERSRFQRLVAIDKGLQLFFEKNPRQPAVTEDVKAEVFDFVLGCAKLLDRESPNKTVPPFKKKDFSLAGFTIMQAVARVMLRKPKKKSNIGALILLALIVMDWK